MRTSIILHGNNADKNRSVAYDLAAHYIISGMNCTLYRETTSAEHITRNIADNIHPSVFISSCTSIEEMKRMQDFLSQKPLDGKNKCAIIQDCHTMLKAASNSCLKCIEEPGENNLIIMTTNTLGLLLSTVRSRCYKIHIRDNQQYIGNFTNVLDYIIHTFPTANQNFVNKFINFLNQSKDKHYANIDDIDSSKIMESLNNTDEDQLHMIPNIILRYLEYNMHIDSDDSIISAKKINSIYNVLVNAASSDQNNLALVCILICVS